MKNMRLIEEKTPFQVNKFEEKTNKEYPYYQSGNKYGLCPACGSSVQIIIEPIVVTIMEKVCMQHIPKME